MRQNSTIFQKPSTLGAAFVFAIATIAVCGTLFVASAHAVIDEGWYAIYTTEDLCELTLDPATATVNANGTQTFKVKIGTSQSMQNTFESFGFPPRAEVLPPAELPETISYYDTADACIYGDVDKLTGLYIKFEVTSGPDAGLVFETELAADGTATFPLTNNGALGTDQVSATATLPQVCLYAMRDVGEGDPWQWSVISPEGCEEGLSDGPVDCSVGQADPLEDPVSACSLGRVRPVDFGGLPGVTLQATASVNWIAAPVTAASTPASVKVASVRSCVNTRVRIRPSYSANLRSARLIIDGKTVKTKTSSSGFVINTAKYAAGKHRFKVVATYDSGSTVTSNTGSFSKCKAKVSVKKVAPKFTG